MADRLANEGRVSYWSTGVAGSRRIETRFDSILRQDQSQPGRPAAPQTPAPSSADDPNRRLSDSEMPDLLENVSVTIKGVTSKRTLKKVDDTFMDGTFHVPDPDGQGGARMNTQNFTGLKCIYEDVAKGERFAVSHYYRNDKEGGPRRDVAYSELKLNGSLIPTVPFIKEATGLTVLTFSKDWKKGEAVRPYSPPGKSALSYWSGIQGVWLTYRSKIDKFFEHPVDNTLAAGQVANNTIFNELPSVINEKDEFDEESGKRVKAAWPRIGNLPELEQQIEIAMIQQQVGSKLAVKYDKRREADWKANGDGRPWKDVKNGLNFRVTVALTGLSFGMAKGTGGARLPNFNFKLGGGRPITPEGFEFPGTGALRPAIATTTVAAAAAPAIAVPAVAVPFGRTSPPGINEPARMAGKKSPGSKKRERDPSKADELFKAKEKAGPLQKQTSGEGAPKPKSGPDEPSTPSEPNTLPGAKEIAAGSATFALGNALSNAGNDDSEAEEKRLETLLQPREGVEPIKSLNEIKWDDVLNKLLTRKYGFEFSLPDIEEGRGKGEKLDPEKIKDTKEKIEQDIPKLVDIASRIPDEFRFLRVQLRRAAEELAVMHRALNIDQHEYAKAVFEFNEILFRIAEELQDPTGEKRDLARRLDERIIDEAMDSVIEHIENWDAPKLNSFEKEMQTLLINPMQQDIKTVREWPGDGREAALRAVLNFEANFRGLVPKLQRHFGLPGLKPVDLTHELEIVDGSRLTQVTYSKQAALRFLETLKDCAEILEATMWLPGAKRDFPVIMQDILQIIALFKRLKYTGKN